MPQLLDFAAKVFFGLTDGNFVDAFDFLGSAACTRSATVALGALLTTFCARIRCDNSETAASF